MISYLFVKQLHITFAVLSVTGFCLRGYWMITDDARLKAMPTRVLPHINDTLLLLTALILVAMSGLYPLRVDWVTLKVLLLIAYIVLGTFALKRGKTRRARIGFFSAALAVVTAIIIVAITKPEF